MKKLIYLLIFLSSSLFSQAQSSNDTKDFISEQIKANSPMSNYKNGVFFENDILKFDAERISDRTLSDDDLKNIFIFMYDVFNNSGTNNLFTVAHIIDIRDIVKVSTTKVSDKNSYYKISVYIGNKYYAKEYENLKIKPASWKYIDKMEILIGDNYEASQKIKKAIIYLGKIQGVTIKDGDLF
jgi:hypothetical protein